MACKGTTFFWIAQIFGLLTGFFLLFLGRKTEKHQNPIFFAGAFSVFEKKMVSLHIALEPFLQWLGA